MMYVHRPSHEKLRHKDVAKFYRTASKE